MIVCGGIVRTRKQIRNLEKNKKKNVKGEVLVDYVESQ